MYVYKNYKRRLVEGLNGNERTVVFAFAEYHRTVYQCKQRVVFTHSNIVTRMVNCASLANQDITGFGYLTTKYFNA